jgi:hypothetical protein
MLCWPSDQRFHTGGQRAIIPLTAQSRLIRPLSKDFCPSLVSIRDGDLERVIIRPGYSRIGDIFGF